MHFIRERIALLKFLISMFLSLEHSFDTAFTLKMPDSI